MGATDKEETKRKAVTVTQLTMIHVTALKPIIMVHIYRQWQHSVECDCTHRFSKLFKKFVMDPGCCRKLCLHQGVCGEVHMLDVGMQASFQHQQELFPLPL